MNPPIPRGAWPILLTPFTDDNTVDFAALDQVVDFYVQRGVPGLLVLGQASEVLHLNDDERFAIVRQVAARSQGRVRTAAVGNFGATLEAQATSLSTVVEAGIDVAVVGISLLPSAYQLGEQLLQLAEQTDESVPLGVYELPEPEHRLLSPEEVGAIAATSRYVFMKDTVRQIVPFTAKVAAAQGTNLKIFQANLKITPPSLDVGACGFCGWIAMVAPELTAQLCDTEGTPPAVRERAYEKLMAIQTAMVAQGFPAAAKYILQQRGLALTTRCRVSPPERFTPDNMTELDRFLGADDWFALIATI
jgi:4-hydroxy-tetrahydrodipicolinate synthase